MRQTFFAFSISGLLIASGCTRHTPVAAARPAPAPVQNTTAAPPAQVQQRAAATVAAPVQQPAQAPQRSATMTDRERATLNEHLAKLEDALFDYDKSTIRSDATAALRDDVNVIRGILNDYPAQKLVIEGHADERGSDEYNVALGDQRARASEDFLSTMGVSQTQLTIISYGKQRPVCTEATEACWQKNRRAHITAAP
jgi:peptidoglycan-associated lipoprotein